MKIQQGLKTSVFSREIQIFLIRETRSAVFSLSTGVGRPSVGPPRDVIFIS